jgi:DNA-binding NarL/FixJ family response regulator
MSFGLRVAIIDSDELVREGRVLLLQSQPETQIVYQSGNATAALEVIGDYLIDVLIVDTRIPGWAADKYLRQLSEKLDESGNDARLLATATFGSHELELDCLVSGASAFVSHEQGVESLLRQLQVLSSGEQSIPRKTLDRLLELTATKKAPHPGLALSLESMDQSQRAVVKAMLEGFSDSQISRDLGLTKYRVTKFIESLRANNGFRTRIQLAIELLGFGAL